MAPLRLMIYNCHNFFSTVLSIKCAKVSTYQLIFNHRQPFCTQRGHLSACFHQACLSSRTLPEAPASGRPPPKPSVRDGAQSRGSHALRSYTKRLSWFCKSGAINCPHWIPTEWNKRQMATRSGRTWKRRVGETSFLFYSYMGRAKVGLQL